MSDWIGNIYKLIEAGADESKIKQWIKDTKDIDSTNDEGKSPLHIAAENNQLSISKLLIKNGANISKRDLKEWTPLHCAAARSHFKYCEYLISLKANIAIENNEKETALFLLIKNGEKYIHDKDQFKLIQHFCKNLPSFNLNIHDESVLHIACQKSILSVVKMLVDAKVDTNQVTK